MVKQGTHNALSPGSIPGRPTRSKTVVQSEEKVNLLLSVHELVMCPTAHLKYWHIVRARYGSQSDPRLLNATPLGNDSLVNESALASQGQKGHGIF